MLWNCIQHCRHFRKWMQKSNVSSRVFGHWNAFLVWKWSHSISMWIWLIKMHDPNRRPAHTHYTHLYISCRVFPCERTQFHSPWILHFVCQSNIIECAPSIPTKSNQKFSIFQFRDLHFPNRAHRIWLFIKWIFIDRINCIRLCGISSSIFSKIELLNLLCGFWIGLEQCWLKSD